MPCLFIFVHFLYLFFCGFACWIFLAVWGPSYGFWGFDFVVVSTFHDVVFDFLCLVCVCLLIIYFCDVDVCFVVVCACCLVLFFLLFVSLVLLF